MDRDELQAKAKAFVDDLNALVQKHGVMLYSDHVHARLEIAPLGSDEAGMGVTVEEDIDNNLYVLRGDA